MLIDDVIIGELNALGSIIHNQDHIDLLVSFGYGKGLLSRGLPDYKLRKEKNMIGSYYNNPFQKVKLYDSKQEGFKPIDLGCEYKENEPLHLFPEETLYLMCEGYLKVMKDGENKSIDYVWEFFSSFDSNFKRRFIAYRKYRLEGMIPKLGLKFGVDLLLYPEGGPSKVHSIYGVRVLGLSEDKVKGLLQTRLLDNTSKKLKCIFIDVNNSYHPIHRNGDYKEFEIIIQRWIPSKLDSVQ